MQLTPVIAVHMTAALGALLIGPVALWARQARFSCPEFTLLPSRYLGQLVWGPWLRLL